MEQKSIKTNGHDSLEDKSPTLEALEKAFDRRVDYALGQAVRFLDKLSSYARLAGYDADLAVNGKNVVTRTNSAVSACEHLQKLEQETKHWFEVLQTMKKGKDVHIRENCKHNKLEIVAGSEYEFGQYIINESSHKFCKENTEGKDYIEKVTNGDPDPQLDFDEGNDVRN